MEEKDVIDVEVTTEVNIEAKETLGDKVKHKLNDGKEWMKNHKKEMLVYLPLVVSSGVEIVKILAKKDNIRCEKELKDLYLYDSKFRHYNELVRKPTASELRMIDHRLDNGEIMSDILDDMGLTED